MLSPCPFFFFWLQQLRRLDAASVQQPALLADVLAAQLCDTDSGLPAGPDDARDPLDRRQARAHLPGRCQVPARPVPVAGQRAAVDRSLARPTIINTGSCNT